MKKDRNCGGAPYPVYPGYPPVAPMPYGGMPNMMPNQPMMPNQSMMPNQPMMMGPMPNPGVSGMMNTTTANTMEQQMNLMQQQINMLDKRVTKLESMTNNNTSVYNAAQYTESNSNFHMM